MSENTEANTKKIVGGASGKGFDVLGQPSPEAKKAGWDRRKTKQEIMDKITEIRNMSMGELEKLKDDIKNNPDNHTVLEAKLVQYLSKEKFTTDFLDRNIGKAPQDIDITTNGERITTAVIKFIANKDDIRNGSDESPREDITSGEGQV